MPNWYFTKAIGFQPSAYQMATSTDQAFQEFVAKVTGHGTRAGGKPYYLYVLGESKRVEGKPTAREIRISLLKEIEQRLIWEEQQDLVTILAG